MNFDFLPENIKRIIEKLNINKLTEIRFRVGYPIKINYNNEKLYLLENGKVGINGQAIICLKDYITEILSVITEKSIYAYNDKIKSGYVTTKEGIRIGLAGDCVIDNGKIITIKNINSLNVRIPHEINDASNGIFNYVFSNGNVKNTLIISPPFYGKTTMLKDVTKKLNGINCGNILLIDERCEFSMVTGENIDVIRNSDKTYAFEMGLRSMSPEIIVTDELCGYEDWICVEKAVNSGIKIIASCHSDNIESIKNKNEFISGVFDIYVLLYGEGSPGRIKSVYGKDFNLICDYC